VSSPSSSEEAVAAGESLSEEPVAAGVSSLLEPVPRGTTVPTPRLAMLLTEAGSEGSEEDHMAGGVYVAPLSSEPQVVVGLG
jgi:hypothetical protein